MWNDIKSLGIIDDDNIFTTVASYKLKSLFPQAEITTSNNPHDDMSWLSNVEILFLDINLGTSTAWDFIEAHYRFLQNIYLVICSSSIDAVDHEKADAQKVIDGFVVKPLTNEQIEKAMLGFAL
ncbi:MAG: response regulator [Flavobacteriales bacterium]|nr:response regulator [Flavobacteriales bacterium]